MADCHNDTEDYVIGTKGRASILKNEIIAGGETWRYKGDKPSMYDVEHIELFAAIRAGKPINNGSYMCSSTLFGIMGRMATYTGKQVTWDQALNSKEDLSPAKYEWMNVPTPEVPMPGQTKLA